MTIMVSLAGQILSRRARIRLAIAAIVAALVVSLMVVAAGLGTWRGSGFRADGTELPRLRTVLALKPGMSVADVGAGGGYYTVRLARIVGAKGRVLAEDIVAETRDRLSDRIQRENLDNVAVKLGTADNPMLPHASFDRIFLVHMYHEVQSPYAFLWHLRDAVKPGGLVIVVDSNRPVQRHGIPPAQLKCELAALALAPVKAQFLTGGEVYLMAFKVAGPRPEPGKIKACAS